MIAEKQPTNEVDKKEKVLNGQRIQASTQCVAYSLTCCWAGDRLTSSSSSSSSSSIYFPLTSIYIYMDAIKPKRRKKKRNRRDRR